MFVFHCACIVMFTLTCAITDANGSRYFSNPAHPEVASGERAFELFAEVRVRLSVNHTVPQVSILFCSVLFCSQL